MKTLLLRFSLLLLFSAMAGAQAPVQLTIPGKNGDSRKVASPNLPAALDGLGTLRGSLDAYFSMDSVDLGGLTWSRTPIKLESAHLVAKEADGHHYLDFSAKGSHVTIQSDYPAKPKCTLTAWVLLPAASENGVIWFDRHGEILTISKKRLAYWVDDKVRSLPWAEAAEPITGWHHVALVHDEHQTQAYLDAKPLATTDILKEMHLVTIGNHAYPNLRDQRMASGIDEQLFFSRALTPNEIATVMNFTKPKGK
jgi:hypothetical protein